MITPEYCLMELKHSIEGLEVANVVLDDPRFVVWSGSSKEGQHHYGDGGLVIHTWEVMELMLKMKDVYTEWNYNDERIPSFTELKLAAIFHDVGKVWDYQKVDGKWTSTEHKRKIHHISRSAIIWAKAEKSDLDNDIEDNVLHAILAHHGQREWGSPVAPKTRLAWLLHLCDGISARMNDSDTLDVINRK